MEEIKNSFFGKRCFIIGNGPSLNKIDLSKLKNEYTFGLNRIYLLFDKLGFETTFLVSVNKYVLDQNYKDINKLSCVKFISERSQKVKGSNVYKIKSVDAPKFSMDISEGVWEGATVTYVAMQIAYYLGFSEVILIGVDHNFIDSKGKPHQLINQKSDDLNHFSPEYFKGQKWQLPDLETSETAYRMAKYIYKLTGRGIYDATYGGKLNVFDKVNYNQLFGNNKELSNCTVYVITAVHDNLNNTEKMLKCISNQKFKKIKVVVVDDGSDDGTSEYIAKHFKEVILINGDGNLWWTGGLNKALEYVLSVCNPIDYVLTMNNDCTFGNSLIESLIRVSNRAGRAIVGSLEIDRKDKNTAVAGQVGVDWEHGLFYKIAPDNLKDARKSGKKIFPVEVLQTKGTIFPIEVFRKIGLFDQKHLPHYASDYEFTMRAKRSGYKLLVDYNSVVYCDSKTTGLFDTGELKMAHKRMLNLLFSRRSQVNIIDHLNLVKLTFPKKYWPSISKTLINKISYFIFRIEPFYSYRKTKNIIISTIKNIIKKISK